MNTNPAALLEQLCGAATPRKEQSLRLVFAICEEQTDRGSRDYSVATIGRISSDRGGPSAAAIRNKPGEEYRALIKAYAASVGGNDRKKKAQKATAADEILEGVSDPVLAVRIKLLLAEVTSLRAQPLATRKLANQTAVLDLSEPSHHDQQAKAPKGLRLTFHEVTALEAAISSATLSDWGWIVDDTGRVTTDAVQIVFRAGFASAIRKTVDYVADF
ncbi:gamma-mobile-trio protein GmtX [Paraburkholderia adhaesiva]|uniref:gamma-mobile-trio protein GmtX n=1 Tax=Paraburkholderia adhaesiva TaxID=2883244 RepID=UPI001EEF341C|nr:gamma-mobile-trio protein GmtX [Paraburkholderia adhaesiva]